MKTQPKRNLSWRTFKKREISLILLRHIGKDINYPSLHILTMQSFAQCFHFFSFRHPSSFPSSQENANLIYIIYRRIVATTTHRTTYPIDEPLFYNLLPAIHHPPTTLPASAAADSYLLNWETDCVLLGQQNTQAQGQLRHRREDIDSRRGHP